MVTVSPGPPGTQDPWPHAPQRGCRLEAGQSHTSKVGPGRLGGSLKLGGDTDISPNPGGRGGGQ